MKTAIALIAATALLLGPQSLLAAETAPVPISDPDMKKIYDADQSERSGDPAKFDWKAIGPRDADRRQQTRALLAAGRLHTGDDFLEAAYVFQHGSGDDFLLAHTLAVIATQKGASGGLWIAAATLDRYLQSHGGKQIYGTQSTLQDGVWSNEPYDRTLISDPLRNALGVPNVAIQDQQVAEKNALLPPPASAPAPAATKQIKCETGPIERVFVRATWRISSCDNGGLMAVGGGEPAAFIFVYPIGDKVVVTAQGGDATEVKVAVASFQAMTPAQVADIAAQTKP